MKEFNGFRSWNAWNVSLWLNNDEGLYRVMLDCLEVAAGNKRKAARFVLNTLRDWGLTQTPDGGRYNVTAIMGAMEGIDYGH